MSTPNPLHPGQACLECRRRKIVRILCSTLHPLLVVHAFLQYRDVMESGHSALGVTVLEKPAFLTLHPADLSSIVWRRRF